MGHISKGYLKGPHYVCINPMQDKPVRVYQDKDTIECSGPCRSSTDGPNYTSRLRVNEGNQYGEFDKVSPIDPNKGKPLTIKPHKNASAFKGKSWAGCGENVTVIRKTKKALTR